MCFMPSHPLELLKLTEFFKLILQKVLDDSCGDRVSGLQKATSYLLPKVAFDFITNVTSSLFGSSSSNSKSGIVSSILSELFLLLVHLSN